MSSLTSKIHAGIDATYQASSEYSTVTADPSYAKPALAPISLDSGTATGQCDTIFSAEHTLAASASENLDMAGSMVDPLGNTVNFGHVKAIEIEADAGNTNNVVVGNTASNAFVGPFGAAGNTWTLGPGDRMVAYSKAGWPVVANTGDLLKVANGGSGTSVKYRITLLGTST